MSEKNPTQSQSQPTSGSLPNEPAVVTPLEPSASSSNRQKEKAKARCRGKRATIHSPEEIREEFRHEQGVLFFRKPRPGRSIYKPAGCLRSDGYIVVSLMGQSYLAHRIIWCLETGAWPEEQIDHIDGCRTNNRPRNLRAVKLEENNRNITVPRSNTGVVGVTWFPKRNRYLVFITEDGKSKYVGSFKTLEEAISAREAAELEYEYPSRRAN